jgi:hypothetical protein
MDTKGHDWEREVLIVAKELMRQTELCKRRYGGEPWGKDSDAVNGIVNLMQGMQLGHITTGDAAAAIQTIDERLEADISATGDPALATLKRSEIEAEAKGLPHLARLLAWDASRAAVAGITKEEWIMQVVRGHEGDDKTQIACLKYILVLWEQGPWPWRAANGQRKPVQHVSTVPRADNS